MLLAYSKIWLYDELLASDAARRSLGRHRAASRYFPAPLRERYAAYMAKHPLQARDHRHARGEQHDQPRRQHLRPPPDGGDQRHAGRRRAGATCWRGSRSRWCRSGRRSRRWTTSSPTTCRRGCVIDAGRLVIRGTTWFLRSHRLGDDMAATIARFVPAVAAVASGLPAALTGEARAAVDARVGDAGRRGRAGRAGAARRDARAAGGGTRHRRDARRTAGTTSPRSRACISRSAAGWRLDSLQQAVAALPADGHWQGLARAALHDDVAGLQQALTREVLAAAPTRSGRCARRRLGDAAPHRAGTRAAGGRRACARRHARPGDGLGGAARVAPPRRGRPRRRDVAVVRMAEHGRRMRGSGARRGGVAAMRCRAGASRSGPCSAQAAGARFHFRLPRRVAGIR